MFDIHSHILPSIDDGAKDIEESITEHLAEEIQKQAQKRSIVANVLVEINSGGEESKGGIDPASVADFCVSLGKYPNIKLCGFMTMVLSHA